MKRLLHPFLFTVVSLLFLYLRASAYVSLDEVVRPLLIVWAIVVFLIFPLYILVRDWQWVGFILSLFVLTFYFSFNFFMLVFFATAVVFIIWWGYLFMKKRKMDLRRVTTVLNFTGAILILIELGILFFDFSTTKWRVYQAMWQAEIHPSSVSLKNPSSEPDIYYIILDGYGRADILQEYYDFDNSQFMDYLSSKGFLIPTGNHSNYPRTVSSVTSTLNMNYLQALEPDLSSSSFWWTMIPFVDKNIVMNSLKKIGYQTVLIDTNWTITDIRTADQTYRAYPVMLNDYESYLLDSTPLKISKPLLQRFASVATDETHKTVLQFNLNTLAALPATPGPKFVFSHILSPHPPSSNEFSGTNAEYKKEYISQLEYLNVQIEETIDAIIENSDIPPIIILQADHGPGMYTDFNHMENTCLNERFSPLAAYYLPGVKSEDLPNDITLVNLFRFIFNQYFQANLPMLENREYSFQDQKYIFDPVDVTDRVDAVCPVNSLPGSTLPWVINTNSLNGQ
jgi:hypothetical protein